MYIILNIKYILNIYYRLYYIYIICTITKLVLYLWDLSLFINTKSKWAKACVHVHVVLKKFIRIFAIEILEFFVLVGKFKVC